MALPIFIKRSLKNLMDKLGYEIIKKNEHDSKKWTHVEHPVQHNSQRSMDNFYKKEGLLTEYINNDRIEFYKEVAGLIKEKIKFSEGQTVADVGCGTGHLLYYLKEEVGFGRATGFDFSPEAIKIAKELFSNFYFYELDIYAGKDEKFDTVLCTEVLEHLLNPELAMFNLLSMVNPGGTLLLTVPDGRVDTFAGHINFWSPESWEVFVKKNMMGNQIETGTIQKGEINFALIIKSQNG
ncbi:MAG TPA: class I SAM-dependent methyltransferase [Bacteroidia bacterium]|jgi:2-polyprenyl-3-methyl-5-hydroxy-6-metoxy-1,4-benzoquinol methylase|nr:class I SAM-dependent methyltransferase [Bacteroidia bacterium]